MCFKKNTPLFVLIKILFWYPQLIKCSQYKRKFQQIFPLLLLSSFKKQTISSKIKNHKNSKRLNSVHSSSSSSLTRPKKKSLVKHHRATYICINQCCVKANSREASISPSVIAQFTLKSSKCLFPPFDTSPPPSPLPFLEGERKSRDSLKFRAAVLYYMLNVDLGIATAPHCLGARLMLGIVSTPIVRYIPPRPPRRHTSMHVTLAGQRRVTWSSIFHRLIVFRAPFFRPARAAGSPFLLFFPRREG